MELLPTNCINCGAPIEVGGKSCNYCGSALLKDTKNPIKILQNKRFRMNALYPMLMGAGFTIIIYIYIFSFNKYSETEMIHITPVWFFFIIFGIYGYFAENMMNRIIMGEGKNISEAYRNWQESFLRKHIFSGLALMIILFPFTFMTFRNSLLIAFLGSVIWGVLLLFFFRVIFPAL